MEVSGTNSEDGCVDTLPACVPEPPHRLGRSSTLVSGSESTDNHPVTPACTEATSRHPFPAPRVRPWLATPNFVDHASARPPDSSGTGLLHDTTTMRNPRLHVDLPLAAGARIALPETAGHHATRVLRLGAGDALTVFDGRGGEYDAVIARASRGAVEVDVGAHAAVDRESTLEVELVQGICKGDRMDLVVQKATELGVWAIRPIVCQRTVVKLDPARAERRIAHWRAIAVHAAQQSGRTRVPEVARGRGFRCVAGVPRWRGGIRSLAARRGVALRCRAARIGRAGTPARRPGRRSRSPGGRARPGRRVRSTAARTEGAADRNGGTGRAQRAAGAMGRLAIVGSAPVSAILSRGRAEKSGPGADPSGDH